MYVCMCVCVCVYYSFYILLLQNMYNVYLCGCYHDDYLTNCYNNSVFGIQACRTHLHKLKSVLLSMSKCHELVAG